jgi:EAL domain-containing protein (putative c-di-GMP-specific phosphodiesterase class I)
MAQVGRGKTWQGPVEDMLAGAGLSVVFQPILDLERSRVFAFEALARTTSKAFPNPPALLAASVEQNCCGELGRVLRMMAVEGCPSHPLFLNVHPHEFSDRWLVRPDDPIFSHDRDIYLEVTESVPLSHYALCNSILREIRGKGVYLAVDDLGAGYSNLKYIADLSPEIVKLDRTLIAGLERESRAQRLVGAIVRLCEELGANVVAEGIETVAELTALRDVGIRFGQGYLFARPAAPPPMVTSSSFQSLLPPQSSRRPPSGGRRSKRPPRSNRRISKSG